MAFVVAGGWTVGLTVKDNNGKSAGVTLDFPAGLPLATIQASAEEFAGHVRANSDGAVVSYSIRRAYNEDDPALTTPVASSEVERKLYIALGTNQFPKISSVEIPSPRFTLEMPGTDLVNTADAAYMALVSFLTSGRTLPGNGPMTYFGDDITRTEVGIVTHRTRKPRS